MPLAAGDLRRRNTKDELGILTRLRRILLKTWQLCQVLHAVSTCKRSIILVVFGLLRIGF